MPQTTQATNMNKQGSMSRYWGKARPSVGGASFHLLEFHCLDVAAVGVAFLRRAPALLQWFQDRLDTSDREALLAFWFAVHDLGKFSISFQGQRVDLVEQLQGEAPATLGLPGVRHDSLGMWLWDEAIQPLAEDGGWFGEGEISYAGQNAEARARLAMDIMKKRMGPLLPLRFDLIGVSSVLGDDGNRMLGAAPVGQLMDIRLRVAGQHLDLPVIDRLLREMTALWTGGPAGGGGVRVAKRQRLSTQSCLIARAQEPASFSFA